MIPAAPPSDAKPSNGGRPPSGRPEGAGGAEGAASPKPVVDPGQPPPVVREGLPFGVDPLTGALGAEISGMDLSQPLDDATFAALHQTLLDFHVLVWRDQTLEREDIARLGKMWGELEVEPFIPNKDGKDDRVYTMTGAGGRRLSTQKLGWHVDHSYQKNPSFGAILYGVDVPATGGDTLFANMAHAYDALSPAMQEFLVGKTAIHDVLSYGLQSGHVTTAQVEGLERMVKMRRAMPQVHHPLVCSHPETGRRFLYLNQAWATAIDGLTLEESKAIMDLLNQHAVQPKFQARVRWRNGTVVMWDNRCVQHSPTPDYSDPRIMLRVAIHGAWEPSLAEDA